MKKIIYILFLLEIFSIRVNSFVIAQNEDVSKNEFPAPLNSENFNTELQQGLHIVEFYSPYCSHCKHLAPIWNETWYKFREESSQISVKFSQVNCIESGDLCTQENVRSYPNIRLYGPQGYIKDYPTKASRTVEEFINFARNESKINSYLTSIDSSSPVSSSKRGSIPLSKSDLIDIIAGKSTIPYLISFWPSSDLSNVDDSIEYKNCDSCNDFQGLWKDISDILPQRSTQTAHFNCLQYSQICKELDFIDLISDSARSDRSPKVALILPNKKVNNIFNFEENILSDISVYEKFVARTYHNSRAPEITTDQIKSIIHKKMNYMNSDNDNSIHIVFAYNPAIVFEEDFDVLDHLIKPLTEFENVYLHKSTSDLYLLVNEMYSDMYSIINYNSSEKEKAPDKQFITLNTLAQYPTFFLFKSGSLIPYIFSAYSTEESRSEDIIMAWLSEISLPHMNKLTDFNFSFFIEFDKFIYDTLAIQIVDSSSDSSIKDSNAYLENLEVAIYDYEDIRMRYISDIISQKRTQKVDKLKNMKVKNMPNKKIVSEQLEGIEYEDNKNILISYLDLTMDTNFLQVLGFGSDDDQYKVGDLILINRNKNIAYREDIYGQSLTSASSYIIRETIVDITLSNHSLVKGSKFYIRNSGKLTIFVNQIFENHFMIFGILFLFILLNWKFGRHSIRRLLPKKSSISTYLQKKTSDDKK